MLKHGARLLVISKELLNVSNKNLAIRNLYAPSAIGLDGYMASRQKVQTQFVNNEDRFREKMREFVSEKPQNIIFTEDLKNMVHLAKDKSDLELITQMMKKFNKQNKEVRFGNFIFGPVAMRMFYLLNEPDMALKCYKDPELEGFFDQMMSYQILLDLLFNNERYQDVLDTFETIISKQIQVGKYPRHVVVLTFASLYKMNTPEALEYCTKLWQDLCKVGHVPMRKGAAFAAALALNHNAPHIALEILTTLKDQHYLTVRNLKALAYAELNRPEEALTILRSVLEIDESRPTQRAIIKEVINKIRDSISRNEKKELEVDFNRISKFLESNGHLSENTLDEILCTEITMTSFNTPKNQRTFIAASFDRNNPPRKFSRNQPRTTNERKGLSEMY